MKIDIRLKELLQEVDLDRRGITQKIAEDLGLHRHTIGKLYRNQLTHPSIQVIEKVCDWLKMHGVEAELPQALFGVRPPELWKAVGRLSEIVLYVGEYEELVESGPARRWLAVRDVEAWGEIVSTITGKVVPSGARLNMKYVRFRYGAPEDKHRGKEYEEDKANAIDLFSQMSGKKRGAIIIGSQRVNYLLEVFVADLFRVDPFRSPDPRKPPKVPFYMLWCDTERMGASCFGGGEKEFGARVERLEGDRKEGIYWRCDENRWEGWSWIKHRQDAGVVIVVYDRGARTVDLAVFGFSGRGTVLTAKKLCADSHLFWEPSAVGQGGKRVGVFVCKFKTRIPDSTDREALAELSNNECDVFRIPDHVLSGCLK